MKLAKVTQKGSRSLYGQFLTMTLLPLAVSGIIMILVASYTMKKDIEKEADDDLCNMATAAEEFIDELYPGEYRAEVEDGKISLYKGGVSIMDKLDVLDGIKEKRGIEMTLFFMDTRMVTTIRNSKGESVVGTIAAEKIVDAVYKNQNAMFYDNVEIDGNTYYAYYEPLYDKEGGECIGMIGVAKPAGIVESRIKSSIIINVVIMGLAIVITGLFIILFANQIILMIKYMIDFMKKLADNRLDAQLNESVTHREDEIGVMGRILVDLQISLRRLIERDALTGLYNRRSAEKKIDMLEKDGIRYCVSIGDIDHFKIFNDSYGHECGDVVLKEVAAILNSNMNGKGFAARWGGEEFLLVFEKGDIDSAYIGLMGIREELHDRDIVYMDESHKVTMTFGLAEKTEGLAVNELIRAADDKLYSGKEDGRDRVIR